MWNLQRAGAILKQLPERSRRSWSKKIVNESSEVKSRWEIKIPYLLFTILGIWPEPGRPKLMRFSNIFLLMFAFYVLPALLGLLDTPPEYIFVSSAFSTTLVTINTQWSMVYLRFNTKLRDSILEEMRNNWATGFATRNGDIMAAHVRLSRKIGWVLVAMLLGNMIYSALWPLIFHTTADPWALWFEDIFYEWDDSSLWFLLMSRLVEKICTSVYIMLTIAIDLSFVASTCHASGQLRILAARIRTYDGNIRHSSGDDIRGCNCLKCIVKSHMKIYQFIRNIDDYFSVVLLLAIVPMIAETCAQLSVFPTGRPYNFVATISPILTSSCYLVRIFLYCWLGEMCQQRGIDLGNIAYCNKWMGVNSTISHNLFFIIRQSRVPMNITVGKYFVLSLELFKKMMFTGWSYLSTMSAQLTRLLHH